MFSLIPVLVVPPWLLGGMRWWQQLIFLGLAIPPFLLCFFPFREGQDKARRKGGDGWGYTRQAALRLVKFPVFWLSLAFLIYCTIGAVNYAYEYRTLIGGERYIMQPVPAEALISWLPQGVKAPFERMDPWRVVVIYSTGLLLVSALWLGIERRRSLWVLLGVVATNAFLLALLTILQSLTGAKSIFWHFESANPLFAASFHYRNHAAAYLYLGLAAALGAAFYFWQRRREHGHASSPAPLFFFFAAIITASLLFAGSRGGVVFGVLVLIAGVIACLFSFISAGKAGLISLVALIALMGLGVYSFWPVIERSIPQLQERWEQTQQRLEAAKSNIDDLDQRIVLTRATLDMWQDRLWTGWGAGSFRYMFPRFQSAYPTLYYAPWSIHRAERHPDRFRPIRSVVYNSHNDWAQSLAEYGVIGLSLLTAILGYWCYLFLRYLPYISAGVFVLYAAAFALFLHGLVDFPFWNPPILLLFCSLLALAGRHLSLTASMHRTA